MSWLEPVCKSHQTRKKKSPVDLGPVLGFRHLGQLLWYTCSLRDVLDLFCLLMNEWVKACSSFKTLHEHSPTTSCWADVEKAGDEAHEKGLTSFLVYTCDSQCLEDGDRRSGIQGHLQWAQGQSGLYRNLSLKIIIIIRGWKRFPESNN